MDLSDQVRQRRALRLQINLADRLADQIVARLVENERSLPPPSRSRLQRLDGRLLTIGRDQAIERRSTDSEIQRDLFDVAHLEPLALGSTEELADCLFPPAGLEPARTAGVRRVIAANGHILIFDVHYSPASVTNVRESNSQIKCTSLGGFLNLNVSSQICSGGNPLNRLEMTSQI